MKKTTPKKISVKKNMKAEYDFEKLKGVARGKYYKDYRAGHKVVVHKKNGTASVKHFKLAEGAVMLEPDVRKYFADSASVNKALRSLIAIIPSKRRSSAHTK
jgi:hypothetical protein